VRCISVASVFQVRVTAKFLIWRYSVTKLRKDLSVDSKVEADTHTHTHTHTGKETKMLSHVNYFSSFKDVGQPG
jgi:ABC-type nickel/cobalt efflux system permease component RcnA